jgi:hypothetical protein
VENTSRQERICSSASSVNKVFRGTCSPASNQGDRDGLAHSRDHLKIKAALGAISIHGVEQNLSDPQFHCLRYPLQRVYASALTASMCSHLKTTGTITLSARINREDEYLIAKTLRYLRYQRRPSDGSGVD